MGISSGEVLPRLLAGVRLGFAYSVGSHWFNRAAHYFGRQNDDISNRGRI